MEQLVARRAHNPKVTSSSLVPATKERAGCNDRFFFKKFKIHCGVEQLVARRAHNPKVTSSSLVPATKRKKAEVKILAFFVSYFLYNTICFQNHFLLIL